MNKITTENVLVGMASGRYDNNQNLEESPQERREQANSEVSPKEDNTVLPSEKPKAKFELTLEPLIIRRLRREPIFFNTSYSNANERFDFIDSDDLDNEAQNSQNSSTIHSYSSPESESYFAHEMSSSGSSNSRPMPGVAAPPPTPVLKSTMVVWNRLTEQHETRICTTNCCTGTTNSATSKMMIISFLYAILLVTTGTAVVVSQEITLSLPISYFEGYYTFLYAAGILFILIFCCFLMRKSQCCSGSGSEEKQTQTGNAKKKRKGAKGKAKPQASGATGNGGGRRSLNASTREIYPRKMKEIVKMREQPETNSQDCCRSKCASVEPNTGLLETSFDSDELESGNLEAEIQKRKTTQNGHHHGSFFMRITTIGFGLAAMIYCGLQFGKVMEPLFTKHDCYHILQVINPVLQMLFTFTLMYFIFMNTRVNIHCYKGLARLGLMHIVATNICIWIRVGVYECMKHLKRYYYLQVHGLNATEVTTGSNNILKNLVDEFNRISEKTNFRKMRESIGETTISFSGEETTYTPESGNVPSVFMRTIANFVNSTTASIFTTAATSANFLKTNSTGAPSTTTVDGFEFENPTTFRPNTTVFPTTEVGTTPPYPITNGFTFFPTAFPSTLRSFYDIIKPDAPLETIIQDNSPDSYVAELAANPKLNAEAPFAVQFFNDTMTNSTCYAKTILDKLVEDSAPFLQPLIIQFSLIGAATGFIIWRHIGRQPRYVSEENIERRLEVLLSQRAVALAQAQHGNRTACEASSKGLFFGLLMLVGSVICLILYFVLIMHSQLSSMAIYLADAAHTSVMILSILAIFIGFIRAKKLKFYPTDSSDLNDLLLAFSAVGMFVYSLFTIISGAKYAIDLQKHFFVMVTGIVAIIQVILQFLYISDMSKRHVSTPESERSKPGRQIVTFLIICNLTMWILFIFESRKVAANPIQLDFYGFVAWTVLEQITLPLCMFHRLYSAVALAEIWKNSYKQRIE